MDRYYESGSDSFRSLESFGSEGGSDDSSSDEESSSSEEDPETEFRNEWQRVKDNNPQTTIIEMHGGEDIYENMTDEDWEQLGHDISTNTHLEDLTLCDGALNDLKMTFLSRGLTGSSSIYDIYFMNNDFGVEGVQRMVPFLQNASNLTKIDFYGNYIGSEGFSTLFRALSDSPIKILNCGNCDIDSIEIDGDRIPKTLTKLVLNDENNINADGCRELTKLLQGADSTLKELWLQYSRVDDEGVKILANALQNNTSLEILALEGNRSISNEGKTCLLKLVNGISSIKATLQSNHTLQRICVDEGAAGKIQRQIDAATFINNYPNAGRAKLIKTQLHSVTRAKLADLQGVHRSVYSEIDPLILPEILSLVHKKHGQNELFVALKSTIVTLFSTVNEKKCIEQEREYHVARAAEHMAKIEELDAKLAAME